MISRLVFIALLVASILCLGSPSKGFCSTTVKQPDSGYISLPKRWKFVDTSILSSIPSTFLLAAKSSGKSKQEPSINITTEPVNTDLKEYLAATKESLETGLPQIFGEVEWSSLGPIQTRAGQASLSEVTFHSSSGEIKMLQAILISQQQGYIITATASKEEFSDFFSDFIQMIQSFSIPQHSQ